jgi:hypothetical protein
MAPTDAKASALYANTARALRDAKARGFDNAVLLDAAGNVAEFATSNLFLVTADGAVVTPALNGTFLAGITRARVIALLADAGVKVEERTSSRKSWIRPAKSSAPATTARSRRACATNRANCRPGRWRSRRATCTRVYRNHLTGQIRGQSTF